MSLCRIFGILLALTFCTYSYGQCLGEDCSIKGRNKAAKKKAVKMTGNRKNGKTHKLKRRGTAYDPFGGSGKKGKGMGGFDPFEADARRKKAAKKNGGGFDPFASNNGKRKFKGNKGGYDPFASQERHGVKNRGNNSWINGNRELSVESGGYAGWDGGKNVKIKNRRGKANDTWAMRTSKVKYSTPKRAGVSKSSNWDLVMAAGQGAPDYTGDDVIRSWSNFEGNRISADITYNKPKQYKFSLIYGSILKTGSTTKDYINHVDPSLPVLGAEFALEWPTTGSKNYHHYFNIPTIGIAAQYLYLGDADALGHVAAVYPYVNIPFVRSAPLDFYFTAGIGLAYVSEWDRSDWTDYKKGNDKFTNPLNGAPVNAYMKAGLGIAWRPKTKATNDRNEKWTHYTLTAEGGIIHMTDASFSQPDKGINIVTAQIGIKYNPEDPEIVLRGKPESISNNWTIDIAASGGARELTHLDNTKYATANLDLSVYYQPANVYRIGLGVDGFFDNSFSVNHIDCDHNKYQKGTYDRGIADQIRAGVALRNEIVFGRVSFALDGGIYFYDKIKQNGERFYFKTGLKYKFTKNWFALANMKTHGWKADFATIGLGYSIQL